MLNLKIISVAVVMLAIILSIYTCAPLLQKTGYAVPDHIKTSPQYCNGKFTNGVEWNDPSIRESLSLIREYFFGDQQRKPKILPPRQNVDLSFFNSIDKNQLNATWLGHSSLMINIDGFKIMIDPVFEKKISIIGPARFNGEIPLNLDDLPQVDVVVISHDHYDHLNQSSIRLLKTNTRRFIVPLRLGERLEEWGVAREKIMELDWWQEYRFDKDLLIVATPAQHFSGRSLLGRYKTLWASWVIAGPRHKIFYSGDSGYFDGFKQIGGKYGPFDMTFLECGAYNKSWHFVHMFPEEVVQAHLDLKGDILHPVHWGTFILALHAWDEPMTRIVEAAAAGNVTIATPIVGETTVYGTHIPTKPWWKAGNIE